MATVPISQIKVGGHFTLQNIEYIRMEEKIEDGSIYCKNVVEGSSGFLNQDKLVVALADVVVTAVPPKKKRKSKQNPL